MNNFDNNGGGPPQETEVNNIKITETTQKKIYVHLMIAFKDICVVTAGIPMAALFICFVTAYIFQADEIHETHCRVYNIIPSISAITGVSPQRYLWRISIALHIGPRLAIAAVYRNYYQTLLRERNIIPNCEKTKQLVDIVFYLNMIEIGSLCGVTYVSNRENYPLHEKIFIVFMICSLCHMLATIKLLQALHPNGSTNDKESLSLICKKVLFALSLASTIGLVLFFLKHRFLCHDMAFSWFALCEYVIATANMSFHCTTMLDFPSEHFLIARNAAHLQEEVKISTETLHHNEQNNHQNVKTVWKVD